MDARVIDACRQFEAVMLRPLLDTLKLGEIQAVGLDGRQDTDGSAEAPGSGIIQSLFTDAFASAIARAGGLGLADGLARALSGGPP
ncbi:MAG: hypothetical protein JO347_07240 [Candidatus Eremiobacteraeota bacterium]|nr:hypothetical protein [Candidatus Eremiobacteraeota bacterium]